MRRDSLGFFWTDLPPEPTARMSRVDTVGDRPLPPIPETGWVAPKEFPRLDDVKVIALDTETKDIDLLVMGPGFRRGAHIVGFSIATRDRAWYFPIRHEICPEENLDPTPVLAWAKDLLERPGILKVGANILYDLDAFAAEGINVEGPFYDVQNAEALLDENRFKYNLEVLMQERLGRGKEKHVLAQWAKDAYGDDNYRANIWRCPPRLVGLYGELDASGPLAIMQQQLGELAADSLTEINDMEQALTPMLLAMRLRGVRVDLDRTLLVQGELELEIEAKQRMLNELAGFDLDVNKATSIARAFDNLGIPYPLTAKTKKPSFTKEWLAGSTVSFAKNITELRSLSKFNSTFLQGYMLDLNVDGRIHCLFNQLRGDEYGTVSGRFSSSLPNLQNIPTRDSKWGPLIRSLFIPDEDCDWGKFDWSQIEFRMVAHYGRGPSAERVREAYRKDPLTDFHRMVAAMIWAERAAEMRKPAKNINFGLVYGMGVDLMAEQTGMTREEIDPIFAQYHGEMPFIRALAKEATETANTRGCIKTLLGRRRRFHLWEPRWNKEEVTALPLAAATSKWGPKIRRAYTHKALNALIQGSAADLMKKAMVVYWSSAARSTLGAPMLTVHDELDFSVPKGSEGQRALKEVREIMEHVQPLRVPVIADLKVGPNWGEAE